jgi:hypothetical protein
VIFIAGYSVLLLYTTSMSEQYSQTPSYSPADHLAALQQFLGETSRVVQDQLYWLRLGSPLMSPILCASVDAGISRQIAANVSQASEYIQDLHSKGMAVVVVGEAGQRQPMMGIGFEPAIGAYQVGVPTPQGPEMLTLGEGVQLDIFTR